MTLRQLLERAEALATRYPPLSWLGHCLLAVGVVTVALVLPGPLRGAVIGAGCYLFRELDQVRFGRWTLDNIMDVVAPALAGLAVDLWLV